MDTIEWSNPEVHYVNEALLLLYKYENSINLLQYEDFFLNKSG